MIDRSEAVIEFGRYGRIRLGWTASFRSVDSTVDLQWRTGSRVGRWQLELAGILDSESQVAEALQT